MLRFSDGIDVDTSGPLRPLHLADGWYVSGGGVLLAADSEEDARWKIAFLTVRQKQRDATVGIVAAGAAK